MGVAESSGGTDADDVERLAKRAAAGDQGSLTTLLEQVRPAVVKYCRFRLDAGAGIHSAEDVAQEVCAALIAALPAYRSERTSFFPFLFAIAARKVADAHRSQATFRRYLDVVEDVPDVTEADAGPEETVLRHELAAFMRPLVDRLPRQYAVVLSLRVVGGLSTTETAELLDLSTGAVRVTQHRALKALRRMIGEPVSDR
jgi:RNA polymerase sigma-70 factor (ECF subfamily)